MLKKFLPVTIVGMVLMAIAACSGGAAPVPTADTVIEGQPVVEPEPVEVIVTQEVEKIVERVVTVEIVKPIIIVRTVEVEKEVPVVETVEVIEVRLVEVTPAPPTPSPTPTLDTAKPLVSEVLNSITYVQHHYDPELERDYFTCASQQGLEAVRVAPETKAAGGPRYVGPNCGDFSLWGANALFQVYPDGSIYLVPQMTGGTFRSPDGIEHERFTLDEALRFFETGDMLWTGEHGEPGRISLCDPRCEGSYDYGEVDGAE